MTSLFKSMFNDTIKSEQNNKLNNYMEILKYIIKYNTSKFYYKKGQITEIQYSVKTTVYGGFIRDIISGYIQSNHNNCITDIDLFIEPTPNFYWSLSNFRRHVTELSIYLKDNLPDKYNVKITLYPINCISKLIDTYGNYKIIITEKNNIDNDDNTEECDTEDSNEITYTFDISTNVNTLDFKHKTTDLYNNLSDYTTNNLKIPVYINTISNTVEFEDLQIRCNKLTPSYDIQDIIQHIQSNIAKKYDYDEVIRNYVRTLNSFNSPHLSEEEKDYEKYMKNKMIERRTKMINKGYSIQ